MTTPDQPSDANPEQQVPPPPPPAPYGGTIDTGPDAMPQTQPAAMPPVSAYPPGYQPPPADARPAVTPTRRQRGPIGAIGAFVAVIVILAIIGAGVFAGMNGSGPLAGIFAAPTATSTPLPPTATPTTAPTVTPTSPLPPAPTGFQAYADPTGSYALYYPTGWTPLPTSQQGVNATVFISSDQQNFALVASNGSEIPPSQYVSVIEAIVQSVGQSVSDVKVTSQPTPVQVGANRWTRVTVTLMFQNKPYSAAIYGTDHNSATTFFVELAPTASFAATNTADYATMLDSFSFLK